ncbi:MAG: hypothetical protein RRB22_01205 [Gammaproteobacteria bacterium]|nr:hypothetical protein [Gammaproteobacteria bacterium]
MAYTAGTRTALANTDRLHSNANGVAEAFGGIDNSSGKLDYSINLQIPINASAVAGTYDVYCVTSQDGVEWDANIDPANVGDVAAKVDAAPELKWVGSYTTVYNASNRAEVEVNIDSINAVLGCSVAPQFFGFVVDNNSGQTIPASGADGDSVSIDIT